MCGRVVPGHFVTRKDATAEAQRDAKDPDWKALRSWQFGFSDAVRFYHDRLQMEKELLEKA